MKISRCLSAFALVSCLVLRADLLCSAATSNFTDANWMPMGGVPGANGPVHAIAVDDTGNVYIGGKFSFVANTPATNVAKWDGNRWSALGSGVDGAVFALATSGTKLYAAGSFFSAGNRSARSIAEW